MCGIAGQLSFPRADVESVRRMTVAMVHRGPDGEGLYADGAVALGHRRLSIIDLTTGAQPQFNEDQSIAVVFNGEIYNYRELMAELEGRHTFRTSSDTEVLVHLYEELGVEMLAKLDGMFAFAIWDGRTRRLFAARDRVGKKPFVYVHRDGTFTFASELGALRASGVPLGPVDREALSDYLELLYIPSPRTIYRDARKLPPAHYLIADERGLRIHRYWSMPTPGSMRETPDDVVAETRRRLATATRSRLRSDVPLGLLLSGGLDSSAVLGLMAAETGPGVKTFSVGFGRKDDELPLARMAAEMHGADHHEIVLNQDVVGETVTALASFSEPFGDSSAVPTQAVFQAIADHGLKVVLTGDGGDELFAGYGRYRQVEQLPHVPIPAVTTTLLDGLSRPLLPQRVSRALRVVTRRGGMRARALVEVFPHAHRAELLGADARVVSVPPDLQRDVDSALAFDLAVYLPDDLLTKTDISSMRWSVEARCPLLDHRLLEYVVKLDASQKQTPHESKRLLRRAISDILPPRLLSQPKRGFGSPVESWLQGPLRTLVHDELLSSDSHVMTWMDKRLVRHTVEETLQGRGNAHQAWALMALEGWARRHAVC